MGTAASVPAHDDLVSLNEFRSIAGSSYSPRIFEVHKDQNTGTITGKKIQALTRIKYDLFLSYDGGSDDQGRDVGERVCTVRDALKAYDLSSLTGPVRASPFYERCDEIDFCQLVLIFITAGYAKRVDGADVTDSCKRELTYAFESKTSKFILPIVMESSMRDASKWTGTLGNLLGGNNLHYLDCSRDDNVHLRIPLLSKMIRRIIVPLHELNPHPSKKTDDDQNMEDELSESLHGLRKKLSTDLNLSTRGQRLTMSASISANHLASSSGLPFEGRCVKSLAGHTKWVRSMVIGPNGDLFSGGDDTLICQWRLEGSMKEQCIKTFVGHSSIVRCLAIIDSDRLLSGSEDATLRVWNISTGECTMVLDTPSGGEIYCCTIWRDGRALCGGEDNLLHLWDVDNGRLVKSIAGAQGWIWCMVKMSDDLVATGEYYNGCNIRIFSISQSCVLQVLQGHNKTVRGLTLGHVGELISVSEDKSMKIWSEQDDGSYSHLLSVSHPVGVSSVLSLPDGSIFTGCVDGVIRLWTDHNHITAPIREIEAHVCWVNCLVLTPNVEIVSGGDDNVIRVWV